MNILVTGGAGYIGSHSVLELLQSNHVIIVLDNLSNSSVTSIDRVAHIAGKRPIFVEGDVRDRALLDRLFIEYSIEAVMHFAGLKAVGDSVKQPLSYYDNNVTGSIVLFQAMALAGIFLLVFSSSATVYGEPDRMPITENFPVGFPTNPYGHSKLMVEQILWSLAESDSRWSVALLRYFNPVGAHVSGLIGEDPNGTPNNLLPYISQVAIGKIDALSVFGGDYHTKDGTGVRDYIHVVDLAKGHLAALDFISHSSSVHVWNLGTGIGYSVMDMIFAFEQASGRKVPYKIVPRRTGDVAQCLSDPTKAFQELGWKASLGLQEMMEDAWRWQVANPNGYKMCPKISEEK
jgi:UDP-glucose 4-epimerase